MGSGLIAERWATLDLLSGGHVDFAAGRGYDIKEYRPFGVPFDESADIFAEGMEIIWRCWTMKAGFCIPNSISAKGTMIGGNSCRR